MDFVNKCLEDNARVVVFSKRSCPYCKAAKKLLDEIQCTVEFDRKVIEIDDLGNCKQIQEALGGLTGASTVPRIFINKKCVGGYTDLKNLHDTGSLLLMISQN